MKKVYGVLIAFFLIFIPISKQDTVLASDTGIRKFYMDATIMENGDIRVKELFTLNGEYNGFDRIINYQNPDAATFNSNSDSFGGSKIHNGLGITLRKIGAIPKDISFANFNDTESIEPFIEEYSSSNYGVFERTINRDGEKYRIYNASSYRKAFYVEYDLQNMGIVHNDIAEIGWNIFSNALTEDIEEFELQLHLPNNKNELRAWAHGPLNGNIEILDKQTVKVTIRNLSSKTAMDVRLAFDKDVIKNSTKLTNTDALSKILVYEQKKADEANQERTVARIKYYGTYVIAGLWLIGLFIMIARTYVKYDKEYRSSFDGKYYREFPSTYGPETVGYLMNKKIGTDDLSASILHLIYKKVISVEEIVGEKKNKKDYKLIYHPEKVSEASLTTMETKLVQWLFGEKSEGNQTLLLSEFKKNAKNGYSSFLSSYHDWQNSVMRDALAKNFYEDTNKHKTWAILYTIIGIFLIFVMTSAVDIIGLGLICFFIGFGAIIYFSTYTKRTVSGNEDYTKWKAFKNFLVDFGNFSQKELPEIVLWEKYLVYAVTLGCATKLAKTMEVKAAEYYPNLDTYYYPGYHFYYMTSLNRAISTGVNSAVSTAISTKSAAESSNSSGSGFGGGFSSGGGSFGGGGGGGRF